MDASAALIAGLAAGLAIAVQVGAVSLLLVETAVVAGPRVGIAAGMGVGVMFTIMTTAAVTLGAPGAVQIDTARQAAQALRPLAGELAGLLFAAGIVGTGLLAVPVLAGSTAHALILVPFLR